MSIAQGSSLFKHLSYNIEKDGVVYSPFHDIPLYANAEKTIFNFVVEIPRWTNAKLEVCSFLHPRTRCQNWSECRGGGSVM